MSRADDHFERDEWLASHSMKYNKIMIVEFNTGGANFIPVQQSSAQRTDTPAAGNDSSVSFSSQSESWQASLKQAAEPRADKVAQATALVNDGTYPSDSDMNRLAGFLAARL